jgi:hypothetical protein
MIYALKAAAKLKVLFNKLASAVNLVERTTFQRFHKEVVMNFGHFHQLHFNMLHETHWQNPYLGN